MAIGTEYTPQPENAAGGSNSPEGAQNIRGMRYYTPERLPHILRAVVAEYRRTAGQPPKLHTTHTRAEAQNAAEDIRPQPQTIKAPAAELPQG